MVQDYSVVCYEGEHVTYIAVACVFLCIYVLGIPSMMFLLLWFNRKHLFDTSSPKYAWAHTALGGLYLQYEPKYWWFELMILFNKTMMCGGLVVLAPGSPLQILAAILIMQLHLLFVLKLAPYVNDSEDWSALLTTLGLMLLSLGALAMLLQIEGNEMQRINIITTILPVLCIVAVLGIVIFVDFGLWNRIKKSRRTHQATNSEMEMVNTQVVPVAGKTADVEEGLSPSLEIVRPQVHVESTESKKDAFRSISSLLNTKILRALEKHHVKEKAAKIIQNATLQKASLVERVVRKQKKSARNLQDRLSRRRSSKKISNAKNASITPAAAAAVVEKVAEEKVTGGAVETKTEVPQLASGVVALSTTMDYATEINKVKLLLKTRSRSIHRFSKAFKKMDKDDNGTLSMEEFKRMIQLTVKGNEEFSKSLDMYFDALWVDVCQNSKGSSGSGDDGKEVEIDLDTAANWVFN